LHNSYIMTTHIPFTKSLRLGLIGTALLLSWQTGLAQDALLQNAQNLLASKQASQAYTLLSAQETARAGQPEFDYLLGVAALDSGRITQAIFALERVLAVQPGNNLARAELARAYIASGETDTAKDQLAQVKAASDVPAQARASVERLLAGLEKASPKPLRFHVEAGLGHDSNLSGGPNISSFAVPALGGVVVSLGAASKQRGDTTLQAGAGLAYTQALSPSTEFNAQLNLQATRPFKEDTLDTSSIDGSLGLAHTAAATRYSLSLNLASLSFDGDRYRKTTGLTGQVIHSLSGSNQLMGFVQLARLDYPSQTLRNARRSVLGGAWGTAVSPATSAYISVSVGGEKATQAAGAEFGYSLFGLRTGAEHVLAGNARLFANLGYERRKHRANDAVFLGKRNDDQIDLTLGLNYQLAPTPYGQWRITPQLNWAHRDSNFSVYEMRRTQVGVMTRLDF
jgi:tetratricopeptide (TPR) repeat protein